MVYFLFAGSLHTVYDVVVAAAAVAAVDVCTHQIEKKMKTPNIHTHNKPHKIRNKHRNETKKTPRNTWMIKKTEHCAK